MPKRIDHSIWMCALHPQVPHKPKGKERVGTAQTQQTPWSFAIWLWFAYWQCWEYWVQPWHLGQCCANCCSRGASVHRRGTSGAAAEEWQSLPCFRSVEHVWFKNQQCRSYSHGTKRQLALNEEQRLKVVAKKTTASHIALQKAQQALTKYLANENSLIDKDWGDVVRWVLPEAKVVFLLKDLKRKEQQNHCNACDFAKQLDNVYSKFSQHSCCGCYGSLV